MNQPTFFWLGIAAFALGAAILMLRGLEQISSGHTSWLSVNRWFRNRVPATPADSVLQGAGTALYAASLLFFGSVAPIMNFIVADLPQVRAALLPLGVWTIAYFMLPYAFGLAFGGAGALVGTRIRWVSAGRTATTTRESGIDA